MKLLNLYKKLIFQFLLFMVTISDLFYKDYEVTVFGTDVIFKEGL